MRSSLVTHCTFSMLPGGRRHGGVQSERAVPEAARRASVLAQGVVDHTKQQASAMAGARNAGDVRTDIVRHRTPRARVSAEF